MTGNDFPADFAEDMPSLVRRAVVLAETTCPGCASYHGPWPRVASQVEPAAWTPTVLSWRRFSETLLPVEPAQTG